MSTVFSFRLDENNPREAQALQILQAWASRGYSLRHVLVEALLAYKEDESREGNNSDALEQIIAMLQEMRNEHNHEHKPGDQDIHLSNTFLNAVTRATRSGMRVE